jgi:hypothetical protein
MAINASDWYESFEVSWKNDRPPEPFAGGDLDDSTYRLKITAGGMLVFQPKEEAGSTGVPVVPPHTWAYIKIATSAPLLREINGSDWCEAFRIYWEESWGDKLGKPHYHEYRMKIMDGGMLLFEGRSDGRSMVVAPVAWASLRTSHGDPTR